MAARISRTPTAADAAAAFADGHVDPPAPVAGALTDAAIRDGADPLETLRQSERAMLTEDVLDHGAAIRFILIVCGTTGFRRGGMTHPSRAEYPLDSFTQEQLDAFIAEPRLEMVAVGGEPIARDVRLFGAHAWLLEQPRDPRLAGEAAAAAISRPPNRAEPGLRNAAGGVAGFNSR